MRDNNGIARMFVGTFPQLIAVVTGEYSTQFLFIIIH